MLSSNKERNLQAQSDAAAYWGAGKVAMAVAGGMSLGTLLYKMYKALPARHPSVPMVEGMHPILGHAKFLNDNYEKMHDVVFDVTHKHDLSAMHLPKFYMLIMNNPKLIEWVFTKEFDRFFKGPEPVERIGELFGQYGQGIFLSDGKQWRFHRKIASRLFSVRNLRDYMYSCCVETTERTMKVLESLRVAKSEIDICDLIGRMTFDCFTSIAFGTCFDSMSQYPKKHPFGHAFDRLIELLPNRDREILWKLKKKLGVGYEAEVAQHIRVIQQFTHQLITEKRQMTKQRIKDESGVNTFDLFSLYENHDASLTDEDMKFIALHFIIAGRDTTRMTTSWFLYDLCQHPEVYKKVMEEIDTFNASHKGGIDYASITQQFKYLEAAICESLRYHPVVPWSIRTAKQDIAVPRDICAPPNGGQYIIKKGDQCAIHQYTVSKLESFYKDPYKYDPMRFYEKGVRTFCQAVYPYFNHNPRLCLGRDFALMEAKIFCYEFLTKYNFELLPNQEITYNPGIILNMKNGLKVKLTQRD